MKVKWCNSGNYCTAWTWHKKQHLIFPLYMYTPGRAESVWHLGTVMGFLCAVFLRIVAWNGLPSPPCLRPWANIQVKQWQTLSSPWWVHDYCGVGECPAILKGGEGERERERETCLSAKMGDKGSSGFCTGTCPKAFLWSFNLLWHASLFHRGQREDCVATSQYEKKCCSWLC